MDKFCGEKERIRLDCGGESDDHGKRGKGGKIVGEEGIQRPDGGDCARAARAARYPKANGNRGSWWWASS